MLLVAIVTGAQATGYTPTADEVIILNEVYDKDATTTGYSTHAAIAWAGTASASDKKAGDPNNSGAATSSNVKTYSVKGNGGGKNITVSITGVSKIIVYHESKSDVYLELRSENKSGTLIGKSALSTYYTEVELDDETDYTIFLHGLKGTSDNDLYVYAIKLIKAEQKTIATQEFNGVKKGDIVLEPNGDYTVDGNTITLTASSLTSPSDIKLINHITYTDESEENKDVAVTMGGVAAGGYFSGSATIGLTEYTVKVPHDATPTVTTDKNAVTVASPKSVTGTATFKLTGVNLTAGSTVSLALGVNQAGLTVSPTSVTVDDNGNVDQTVTVSFQSDADIEATNANLTISNTAVDDVVVTVTYSSTAPVAHTQADVTAAATWDWSKYGTKEIKFTDATTPSKETEFLLANVENYGYAAPAAAFGNAEQLVMTCEYVVRDSKYYQGPSIKFNTTVPGKVTVKYCNTGNRSKEADRRFLNVNGINYGTGTMRSDETTTTTVSVAAGEVAITGKFGPSVTNQESQYLRIYTIEFTPTTTETVTIPSEGVATYVAKSNLDFSTQNGAFKAYVVTEVSDTKATTAEVTSVPAGTALLLKGAAGDYDVEIAASAEAPATNLLKVSDGTVAGGDNIFAFSKSDLKFKKVASTIKVPAGKCYLQTASATDAIDIDFGEATAVEAIAEAQAEAAAPVKVIKGGKLYIGNYNVAGQQVK